MKYTFVFLALFVFINSYSQTHEVVLRNLSLGTLNRSEIVEIDSLSPKPEAQQNNKSYTLDLGYKKTNIKGNGYVMRLGIREFNQNLTQISLRDQGREGYVNILSNQKSFFYSLSGGVFTSIYKGEKITANIGSELQLSYKPPHEILNRSDLYSRNETYEGSSILIRGVPRNIRTGINLNLNTYYQLLKRLSIGLEFNLGYFFENNKGDFFERRELLDENAAIVADIEIPHIINRNSFTKSFLVGIGVQYQFGD